MENLRDIVELFAYDLRDGIPWVIFWREGRSWDGDYIYLDSISDTIESDDMDRLEQISRLDPGAVALNGYYCGRLGEDMSLDELTQGVRWHYEHGYNLLSEFIAGHTAAIPPEQVEETKQNTTKKTKRRMGICQLLLTRLFTWNPCYIHGKMTSLTISRPAKS